MNTTGTLLIVSGPSGSGKTTLCRRAAEAGLASYSISCTTRPPRPGEQDGVDYYFLSPEEFDAKVEHGAFLEHATVHANRYGTLIAHIKEQLELGKNIVMDIDVQGAASVRNCADELIARAYADVYIYLSDAEVEARLRSRETDDEKIIALRLHNAHEENARIGEYQYRLHSADRDHDFDYFKALLLALSMRNELH